jgi:rhodanese-related sulfurtransferase
MTQKSGQDLIDEAKAQIDEVTPEQVRDMQSRDESVVYLDVREPNEWNLGRMPRAIHLPRGNLENKVEALIDRSQKVVVGQMGVVLEIRQRNDPIINHVQRHLAEINMRLSRLELPGDGVRAIPV